MPDPPLVSAVRPRFVIGEFVRLDDYSLNFIRQISKLHRTTVCLVRDGTEKNVLYDKITKLR
jgi:hypothetical protein